MESFLNRYRNITVLLLVIFAQLILLAIQVKNERDVPIIRSWAVTTVTPVARIVEWFRGGSVGFLRHYILLHDASEENRKLRDEVGRLRIENNFLSNELNTADRAKALQAFQTHTQSKMLAANVIGTAPGSNSKVVYVNRGSAEGVMRGMAVVTPDGIVGKVVAAYPTAAEVMLITDPEFAAGVVSQKSFARGTVKGQGTPICKVEHVPFEDKVELGEWFYTSGDDRVFPRGFAVGVVKGVEAAKPGSLEKEILLEPTGVQHGVEDVLIILESVHQAIPDTPPVNQPIYIAPPPPAQTEQTARPSGPSGPSGTTAAPPPGTEADKLRSVYKSVGEAQNHNFGEGAPGSKPPDFTKLPATPLPATPKQPATSPNGAPATSNPAVRPPAANSPAANPNAPASNPARPPAANPNAPAGNPARPPAANPNAAPNPNPPAPKPLPPATRQGLQETGAPAPATPKKNPDQPPAKAPGGQPPA